MALGINGNAAREVLGGQPQPVDHMCVAHDHDHPAGDPPQLAQTGGRVVPVMHRIQRHRGIEAAVDERQPLGRRQHRRSGVRRPLGDHHRRGLDRQHGAVTRLVRPGAGADVQQGAAIAQGGVDLAGQLGILAAARGVGGSQPVVQRRPHSARTI